MVHFQKTQLVQHSADRMFDLVAKIALYPEFVPLCTDLTVHESRNLPDGRVLLLAEMTVAYKLFRESFTTQVLLDCAALKILVTYLEGPFSHLETRWVFHPRGENQSEVDFFITYQLRSRMLQLMVGGAFERAFTHLSAAFMERADAVYGKPICAEKSAALIRDAAANRVPEEQVF